MTPDFRLVAGVSTAVVGLMLFAVGAVFVAANRTDDWRLDGGPVATASVSAMVAGWMLVGVGAVLLTEVVWT